MAVENPDLTLPILEHMRGEPRDEGTAANLRNKNSQAAGEQEENRDVCRMQAFGGIPPSLSAAFPHLPPVLEPSANAEPSSPTSGYPVWSNGELMTTRDLQQIHEYENQQREPERLDADHYRYARPEEFGDVVGTVLAEEGEDTMPPEPLEPTEPGGPESLLAECGEVEKTAANLKLVVVMALSRANQKFDLVKTADRT